MSDTKKQKTPEELTRKDADYKRLRKACVDTEEEIQQILGRALGYPWFKDDQKNFPGATEADGVCVGDNVAATLAQAAVERLERKDALIRELGEALESVSIYGGDTLSGPARGTGIADDRAWHRDGLLEVVRRARTALAEYRKWKEKQG